VQVIGLQKGKKGDKGKGKGSRNDELTIFVGGLCRTTEESVLRKDFEECGEIVSLRMPLNDEGQARGIAFIEFKDQESVDKAIKFDGDDYGGRRLGVRMVNDDSGKGKGKDGKDGKGKGKGKDKKGKKGKSKTPEFEGKKQTFDDSDDDDEEKPAKKKAKKEESSDDE